MFVDGKILLIAPLFFGLAVGFSLYYYHIWDLKRDERKERERNL